jgi:hypothetical protein
MPIAITTAITTLDNAEQLLGLNAQKIQTFLQNGDRICQA